MIKLNLGCGRDYRPGWTNVDSNRHVKADVYTDMMKGLPFADNSVHEVLMDNVIEHIYADKLFPFMDELYRVCHPNAQIQIFAPHYSGMHAFKHPGHHRSFGIGSFSVFYPEKSFNGERYGVARFRLEEERLLFFHHNLITQPWLSKLPINGLFNCSLGWQMLMERFQFLGFDEMYYRLEASKD